MKITPGFVLFCVALVIMGIIVGKVWGWGAYASLWIGFVMGLGRGIWKCYMLKREGL